MRRGSSLIIVIAIISSLTVISALMTRIVYNNYASAVLLYDREIADSLAESGIVLGKVRLANNPSWISAGETQSLGCGSFTVSREFGASKLVSVGQKGKAQVVLKRSI